MTDKAKWPQVKFGDVVQLNRERIADHLAAGVERYIGIEHIEPEDLRVRSWGLVEEGTTFTNAFRPGQVLFVKRRAYQRKVAVADFSGVCSSDIYVLESADPEVLLPDLLPFLCQTEAFFEHAVGTSAGSLSPRTNWERLAAYEFALPPLAEQRRIAEVLWAVESLLVSLNELATSLSTLYGSVVENCLSFESISESFHLNKKADVSYGLTVNQTRRRASTKIPYLRVANVLRGELDLNEIKEIGFFEEDEQHILQKKDVLVVEGHANPEEIGRAALWNDEIDRCAHQNHLIRIRCRDDLDPEFLTIVLNSTHGRRHFLSHAKSTSGLNTINSMVVRNVTVPDLALNQQREIVDLANGIKWLRHSISSRYDSTKEMKAGILATLY